MGSLRQVTGHKSKKKKDGTWISVSAARVIKEAINQTLGAYIDKRQVTVAEWVALRPVLEICDRETGYKVEGGGSEPWWQQTAD